MVHGIAWNYIRGIQYSPLYIRIEKEMNILEQIKTEKPPTPRPGYQMQMKAQKDQPRTKTEKAE
jgi:hypothetical protein